MQSVLSTIINLTAWFVRILPLSMAIALGRFCGWVFYCVDRKHRRIAYQNMKIAFASEYSLWDLRSMTRKYFMNFGANFVEFLRLPLYRQENFQKVVQCDGADYVHDAIGQGKGAVLMTMHYGNWELSTLAISLLGYEQSVIFKVQENASAFNQVMIDCRKNAYKHFRGMNIFERGMGARQLIAALKNNQIVGMLIDQ